MRTSLDSYVTLGRSGLRVSPLTLGTMTFGEDSGWGCSPEESEKILQTYLDRGGNSIDTANIYTNGHSEKILGDYFAARPGLRDRIVLGTKFFANLYPGDPNGGGAGRKAIIAQLEQSLRRLRTDYVDLYWLHNWDRGAPIEETLRAMDDLVTAGKVRYLGLSDVPAWYAAEAQTTARFRGWSPVVAMQLEYSLLERTVEGELIPMARHHGLAVMPWGPLKSGFLSGKYTRETAGAVLSPRSALVGVPSADDYDVIDALRAVAGDVGASPAAVALAWARGRAGVGSTLIGARSVEQLNANLESLAVELAPEQVAALDEVSAPTMNFPAANHAHLAPMLQFSGATVDGVHTDVWSSLANSPARY
ncbi:aldo/keto reductase [Cryptosporangium phraense]|uniref:Aldo/keto reductase n=1 Tax=Cryptosporangium phraense TaxID=2593070 RepID=A0A545ASS9_9ACTN|nr:aldo/keto reductase [Cryptosporangium phraense]TQS44396.1 aldo/keto reductase [Cryptosporangium phraense]